MRTRKRASTAPIPQFVAPRYGDTDEEDRAFRREQVLEALTDGLYRLRLRQATAEIEARQAKPSTTPERNSVVRRAKAGTATIESDAARAVK